MSEAGASQVVFETPSAAGPVERISYEGQTVAVGLVAAGIGETLLGLSYSRDAEGEADRTGIQLLQQAGLRADGIGRFFERFDEGPGEAPTALNLLSTHSSSETRARLAEQAGLARAPAMSQSDWQALQQICGPEETPSPNGDRD
jgi:predicted Zn-dependent protease